MTRKETVRVSYFLHDACFTDQRQRRMMTMSCACTLGINRRCVFLPLLLRGHLQSMYETDVRGVFADHPAVLVRLMCKGRANPS